MDNKKMRAEFEAWAEDWPVSRYAMRKAVSGEYKDVRIQLAWESWQAARAALVVELPETELTGAIGMAHKAVTKRCRTAIEAAGVQVKS